MKYERSYRLVHLFGLAILATNRGTVYIDSNDQYREQGLGFEYLQYVESSTIILSLCILLLCISLKARLLVLLIVVLLKVWLKMPNLQEMKKMFLKSIRTFKSIPLLVTLLNAHLNIFFFNKCDKSRVKLSIDALQIFGPIVLLVCFVIIFNSLSRIRGEFFDMSPFIMVVCTMSRKSVTQTKFCCRPPRKKKKSRGRENSKNQMQSEQPFFFPSVVCTQYTQFHAVVPVVLYHI